ncbi:MAG: M23 family metallopeptidase, partial [Candidatus Saccharimonadales bacterium]
SLGVGQNSVLKGYAGAADFLSVSDPVCKVVQNWFVRGAGLITGLALAFGSFGATLVPQAALAAGMFIATMTLQAVIDNALSGSIIGEGMEAAPVERGAAVWTGMASIHAQSAQTRGMIPGTAKQIAAYNGILNEVNNTYIAAERAESGPFDINNQYSFLGSFSRSLLPYFSASKDVASTTGSVLSLTGKSFASLFGSATSYAATLDEERFKVCDDVNYLEMGLAPDVQCNLRFVMPQPDLNRDVEDVIDYMENNGYVEKDTTTGLPIGYEPPTPQQSQGFAMNMLNGVKDSFYNSRNYGEGKGAEYGKFLDYCAYRSLPFGKTFDEGGAYGAVDEDWLTGKRCLGDDEMISNFRVYTMDKSVSEAMDEDEIYQQSETVEEIDQSDVVESTGKWAAPAPAYSVLSQRFGNPVAYNSAVPIGGGRFGHNGADISGTQKSEQVFAACDGVIAYTTYPSMNQGERTNANTIVIDCGGETSVGYHHATLDSSLKVGSRITAGSKLGRTDNSGNWGGWHIHLTVKVKGSFVDPIPYFKDKGIQLLK